MFWKHNYLQELYGAWGLNGTCTAELIYLPDFCLHKYPLYSAYANTLKYNSFGINGTSTHFILDHGKSCLENSTNSSFVVSWHLTQFFYPKNLSARKSLKKEANLTNSH
ncbi:hypothetical protein KIL84_002510 [Mauremys mutica]|uniref:Uncharacterized protein n=1 Tax=Mauremys mutica TaxID=74926 RepID=A0A9D3X6Z3_9SAUR|nr:hypothetical protein KIL84_002510 [Mauremys mutica]